MRSTRWVTALCLVATTPTAFGQECLRGFRETTAAERQTMTRALETVKSALPAAPSGWIIGGYEEISVAQSLCMDYEGTLFSYGFSRTYNRGDDVAEREQFQADAGVALRASMAERQPRIDALMAKSQELSTQLADAAQKGDQARIDAIDRELEQLQAQMQAIFNEGPSEAQLEALGAAMSQDRTMTISVRINPAGTVTVGDGPPSAAAPTGARAAFREQTTREGATEARAVTLFGSWEAAVDGRGMQIARRGTVSTAAVHGVVVTVTADPARLDSIFDAIDFDPLTELMR
jgi:hypothetical protein